MRRLSDGVFAVIDSAPHPSRIHRLASMDEVFLRGADDGLLLEVDASHTAELSALAQGIPDETPAGPLFTRLARMGLAGEGLDPVDPALVQRLADLGAGLEWRLDGAPDAAEVLALMRRVHARRKLFLQSFGQTPCLPEAAVARCFALRDRLPVLQPDGRKSRVLLIGDDDLLSFALAHMGYDVTAIDIDPLVIAFIDRTATELGVAVRAQVLDVLAPLPMDFRAAFDVVLTDPMSFEKCLIAFLSRALAAVAPGGHVWTCVHPLARSLFSRVAQRLPVRVAEIRSDLSVYMEFGYRHNGYRSDYFCLQRTDAALPWHPDDTIPFSEITDGTLSQVQHAYSQLNLGGRLGGRLTADALEGALRSAHPDLADVHVLTVGDALHASAPIGEAGYFALSITFRPQQGRFLHVPFDADRDEAIMAAVEGLLGAHTRMGFFTDATPIAAPPATLV